jgi:hypothetical protein
MPVYPKNKKNYQQNKETQHFLFGDMNCSLSKPNFEYANWVSKIIEDAVQVDCWG